MTPGAGGVSAAARGTSATQISRAAQLPHRPPHRMTRAGPLIGLRIEGTLQGAAVKGPGGAIDRL